MPYLLPKHIVYFIIKCIWFKEVKGIENLKSISRGAILASNHESLLDAPIIMILALKQTNKWVRFIVIKDFFSTPFKRFIFGTWLRCIHLNGATNKAIEALKQGHMLALLPEGPRIFTGKMNRAHTGVAFLTLKTGLPVIPIGLNTFNLWPRFRQPPKLKKKVRVNIGKPLYFKENAMPSKRLLEKTTRQIMQEIAKLAGKKYKF